MLLSSQTYDVIISEPSNPWMSGVAALFTREFFEAARSRLEPGGIFCQWTHTYNMSDDDLRSVVPPFHRPFPRGRCGSSATAISSSDLPALPLRCSRISKRAGAGPASPRIWHRSRHSTRLRCFRCIGDSREIQMYARSAEVQTDDRLRLEFSAPIAFFDKAGQENTATLLALRDRYPAPAIVRRRFHRPRPHSGVTAG